MFDLAIRYDDLPGEGAADKARELVAYLDRRGRIPQLIRIGKRQRPDIPWDDILEVVGDASLPTKPIARNEVNAILEEAVIVVEDYLTPQSLVVSDSIAELVRNSFQKANLAPRTDDIVSYLRKQKAAYRVVGYLAFQASAERGHLLADLTGELVACVGRERRQAIEPHKETRPLWQLLVCFTYLLMSRTKIVREEYIVKEALVGLDNFLHSDTSIDPGGECKNRISYLLSKLV